jgi:hypothetical protein
MLFKCNRNYNNLLHMFVNDIAQRNMINSAVGGRDNSRTTYSSNQSSSRDVKELTVAEMLLSQKEMMKYSIQYLEKQRRRLKKKTRSQKVLR